MMEGGFRFEVYHLLSFSFDEKERRMRGDSSQTGGCYVQ